MSNEKVEVPIDTIDRRRGYYLMLDDETCPIDRIQNMGVDPLNMLAYDIGYAICDKHGNIYEKGSLCIAETFGEIKRMNTAYYSYKIPKYFLGLADQKRIMVRLADAQNIIMAIMDRYGTNVVVGHNIRFDLLSLNRTCEFYQGVGHYFFPYNTVFFDTMKMVQDTIAKRPTYISFCQKNGYLTARGQPKVTVEVVYRYMVQDTTWTEAHQGLDDVEIQVKIMAKCFAEHKKMRKFLF